MRIRRGRVYVTTPPNVSPRVAATTQIVATVAALVMAFLAYMQLRQAARSAEATERTNNINVASARAAAGPLVNIEYQAMDSTRVSGDSCTCWFRLRVRNDDSRNLRVISLGCAADSHPTPLARLIEGVVERESLIPVGHTTTFQRSVKVEVPATTGAAYTPWLHVCLAIRPDGPVGTYYTERTYILLVRQQQVASGAAFSLEYSGMVYGMNVRLFPWYEDQPAWLFGYTAYTRGAERGNSQSSERTLFHGLAKIWREGPGQWLRGRTAR